MLLIIATIHAIKPPRPSLAEPAGSQRNQLHRYRASRKASENNQHPLYAQKHLAPRKHYCAFLAFAIFISLRLFSASGLFSVSSAISHHRNELE